MLVIPAIDIMHGKCVRLVEGRKSASTVYGEDPAAMARSWQEQGAGWLHVVDLDGAFAGTLQNMAIIKDILAAVNIPVEVGGGIRDLATVEKLLTAGVRRVILGTAAVSRPELLREACRLYGEAIVLGLDARDGQVAIKGWEAVAAVDAVTLALEMKENGIQRVIYTDISRDGTLRGPNIAATQRLAEATGLKVIASGGVSRVADIQALRMFSAGGVEGVIVGKALYAGAMTLAEAMAAAAGGEK